MMNGAAASVLSGTSGRREEAASTAAFPKPRFEDLSSYEAIVKYRRIGQAVGIKTPFFNVHETRSGATAQIDGKTFINFASYDYLGLNQAPDVGEAAKEAIDAYGTSVSASRIVAGERPFHNALEKDLADFYGAEDAIVMVSGHATNVTTISELMNSNDLIICDELMHNSALVGSAASGATVKSFRHNNLDALERILREHRGHHTRALIVVEGLYSMDGDFPDLARLVALKEHYGAWLMVDEAHGLGVVGKTGRGVAEHFDIDPSRVDIWMGTLSKTLGACGGYIAGSAVLVEILKYKAPGFVYSVGMSPPVAAAARTALRKLIDEPERVTKLQANGQLFMKEAQAAGLDTGTSAGLAVVPVMVGDSLKAVKLTERLHERGVIALPIIYPAVPLKAARLRFFITSEHTHEQLRETVRITKEELSKLSRDVLGAAARKVISMF